MKIKPRYRILLMFTAILLFTLAWGRTAPESQAADPVWDVKYWNNKDQSGNPVVHRTESDINYDWGTGSPVPGVVNHDNFSVRWKRVINFPAGSYRFTATMDDGMRVWVDDVLIIDSWWDSQVHSMSKDIYLNAGDHEVKVRYYDAGGDAIAKLSWAPIGGPAPVPIANWKGEYYNNKTLSGTPVLVRDDVNINFEWGVGSPAWNVVASDQFSVRWTRTMAFEPGRYRFTVIVDDGVRLWINGQLLVNQWQDSNAGTYFVEVDLPGGSIPLQMEYYENLGGAVARLSWEKLSGSGFNNWRGEYFNNKTLSGTPALTRDDAQINFNWGTSSPVSGVVAADAFSVRWTRSLAFNAGRYRFTVSSDDGVRVWVNNQQIIDGWYDHPWQTFTGDIDLSGGTIPVRVEYYDNTGGAQIQLSWAQITAVPQPTPVPAPTSGTGVVQSARLNVRHGPGLQYGVITQLVQTQSVTLAGYRSADGNWVMINWGSGTAWVSGRPGYLWTSVPVNTLPVWQGPVGNPSPPTTGPTATVTGVYYLNLRSGPGATYTIIKAAPSGTVVSLLGRNSTSAWANVRLPDGTVGWMSASYLTGSVPISSLPVVN